MLSRCRLAVLSWLASALGPLPRCRLAGLSCLCPPRTEVEELLQRLEVDQPFRAGGELPGPYCRPVQDLAEDAVDGGRRLGPLLLAEVREPVVQPGQFGVGELPYLCVHRGDDGRGGRL